MSGFFSGGRVFNMSMDLTGADVEDTRFYKCILTVNKGEQTAFTRCIFEECTFEGEGWPIEIRATLAVSRAKEMTGE